MAALLVSAAAEASRRDHDYVGTEHVVLALLADHAAIPTQVLPDMGVVEELGTRLEQVMDDQRYREGNNSHPATRDSPDHRP
jgi:ATP-dependent Clp protease ATP-binding subunit ClpA